MMQQFYFYNSCENKLKLMNSDLLKVKVDAIVVVAVADELMK
jgi:O-acetyl-ADP-ribose deacetylase (regulator of RNase III)